MNDKIENYCDEHGEPAGDLSSSEELFLRVFARFLKQNPQIREVIAFDFSPLDYFNVSEYLGYEAGQGIIFNSKEWPRDVQSGEYFDESIEMYRLQYVIDAIGCDKLSSIIDKMIDTKKFDLFERLSKALGHDVTKIYSSLEKLPSSQVKLGPTGQARFQLLRKWGLSGLSGEIRHRAEQMMEMEELFSRPILVDFTAKERSEIIDSIYAMDKDEFESSYNGIGYFLANFILHETEWSFKEILPLAIYLITETPIQNPDSPTASNVSWFCSEIIERCYKLLPNIETIQKHYRDLIYQIYWPRLGSLWPLLHWDEIDFKDDFRRADIAEAANAVLSLEDVEERNSEIAAYVKSFPDTPIGYHRRTENDDLFYCGLRHEIEPYSPKEQFDLILKEIPRDECGIFFDCPNTTEEAEVILGELFRDYKECRFGGLRQLWSRLFGLVESQNVEGVGCYILNYLVENLEKFAGIYFVSDDIHIIDDECVELLNKLFYKACRGITERDELEPLAKLGRKIYAYGDSDAEKMKESYAYATLRAKTIAFQSSEIAPMFEKPYAIKFNKEKK